MDLPSTDEDIGTLREQIKALQAKVAALEERGGRRAAIPESPVTERGVTISFPTPPPATDPPRARELAILRDICRNAYPAMCDSDGYFFGRRVDCTREANEDAWLSMFSASILAISNLYVLPKPDKRWAVSHFVDVCNDTLIRIGRRASELRGPPLVMACFVMRVPVSGAGIMGASISLGLSEYTGKPVDPSAWRQTLSACRLPPQFPLDRTIQAPSPVRIYGQGYTEAD